MRGQEDFEVTRDDAPLATEINRPELLQLDPVTDARLRHLNQVRNFLHGEEPSRQHRATPVCRLLCLHSGKELKVLALTYINAR
jgi:hypothetical protein